MLNRQRREFPCSAVVLLSSFVVVVFVIYCEQIGIRTSAENPVWCVTVQGPCLLVKWKLKNKRGCSKGLFRNDVFSHVLQNGSWRKCHEVQG